MKTCQFDGCMSTPFAKGFCIRHYGKKMQLRADNKSGKTQYNDPTKAFAARSHWQGDCLVWIGSASPSSQVGCLRVDGKTKSVRHVAWFIKHGEWPVHRLKVTCGQKRCVNIAHLEPMGVMTA